MKENKDRRVINIPKTDYDLLKAYCDENTLDMPKWMVKNSKERIPPENCDDNGDDNGIDDLLCGLTNKPTTKTYENIKPEFRLSKEFLCGELFPTWMMSSDRWKFVKDSKHKRFIIKQEMAYQFRDDIEFSYYSMCDEDFITIKNAYKDLCDRIEWGVQTNIEDKKTWWVYILNTKDKSYYE